MPRRNRRRLFPAFLPVGSKNSVSKTNPRIIRVGLRTASDGSTRNVNAAFRPRAMVNKAADAAISGTASIVRAHTNQGVANVVENIMTTGKTAAGNYINKVAAERLRRAKQKLGVKVLAPETVDVAAETLDPGERATVHMDSTTSSQANVQGNTIGKMYKLNDTFTVARSKWLREKMKDTVKNTIVVRNDNEETSSNFDVIRRGYSTCGINRKGLYYPFPSSATNSNFAANKVAYDSTGYFATEMYYPTHGFYAQDYNAAAYVQLMLAWFQSSAFTQEQRNQLRVTLPVTGKKLVSTITNRNAYTPVDFTLYVIQNKGHFIPENPMEALLSEAKGGIPAKYLYPKVQTVSYSDVGVVNSGFPVDAETSMHLKATPFMSKAFTENYNVVRVHKFTLAPNDVMEYSLSCAMNGLNLKTFMNAANLPGGYNWDSNKAAWSLPLAGDYSLMLTFQGGVKTTAGFAFVNEQGQKAFPRGMATDNVTVPCEVSMRSKVTMDILDDDYYDQKNGDIVKKVNWDGTQAWIDGGTTATNFDSRFRRNALLDDLALRKPREYPPLFNVAADELVDPDTTSTTGWYTQVQSKVSWKTVNQQSTPS